MKHSQIIGFTAALLLIATCFLPWSRLPTNGQELTGFATANTSFGRPGIAHSVFAGISAICFLIPALWAKRTNVGIASLGLAWTIRNFILFTGCSMGDCPTKLPGIYLMLFLAILILAMSLLPKLPMAPPGR